MRYRRQSCIHFAISQCIKSRINFTDESGAGKVGTDWRLPLMPHGVELSSRFRSRNLWTLSSREGPPHTTTADVSFWRASAVSRVHNTSASRWICAGLARARRSQLTVTRGICLPSQAYESNALRSPSSEREEGSALSRQETHDTIRFAMRSIPS